MYKASEWENLHGSSGGGTAVKSAAGTGATLTLLDWYDLDYELILVLERPVPCVDLIDYMDSRGSTLQEHEAKVSS